MVIQRAKTEEVHEIKKVLTETWIDTYGKTYSKDIIQNITSKWHKPELLILQIQNPDVYFGVAKEQNQIVGLVTVRRIDKNVLMINRLYILPNYQRKGIGKKLMEEAIRMFKECRKLKLEVEEQNAKGMSFYKKMGFKEIGRKIETIGNDEMLTIEMEKDI